MTLRSKWISDIPTDKPSGYGCNSGYDFDTWEPIDPCDGIAMHVVNTSDGHNLDFCDDHFDMYYSVMAYIHTLEEVK